MGSYTAILIIVGLSGLTMAWLPGKLSKVPLSYPILFIIAGAILYKLPFNLPLPSITEHNDLIVRFTEAVVIISLMGTGLKIDTKFSFKNWRIPFRLISVTMVLSIGALAFLGWYLLSFSFAAALLLGASLAPTDPVLASDVQVGPPNEKDEDRVRFSLTAEAGLNDGMAFPFVWMAIALAGGAAGGWFQHWLIIDFLYKIAAGTLIGYLLGKLLSYIFFSLPEKTNFPKVREGFVALAATFLVYGIAEAFHSYGFLAVFFAGLTMSRKEKHHQYHKEMHHFIDQIERFLLVMLLIPFGGAITNGLFDVINWEMIVVAVLFIFIIRPISGLLALIGVPLSKREKVSISFLAIRGIGSFYYLSFGIKEFPFLEKNELWAAGGFIIILSIIIHGITATPLMAYLDKIRRRR